MRLALICDFFTPVILLSFLHDVCEPSLDILQLWEVMCFRNMWLGGDQGLMLLCMLARYTPICTVVQSV